MRLSRFRGLEFRGSRFYASSPAEAREMLAQIPTKDLKKRITVVGLRF